MEEKRKHRHVKGELAGNAKFIHNILASFLFCCHTFFPWDVAWAEWAEPGPGCNQLEFTHFITKTGTIAGMERGIQKEEAER